MRVDSAGCTDFVWRCRERNVGYSLKWLRHPPGPACLSCDAYDRGHVVARGEGTVYSFTVVHRSPDPGAFVPPYAVALVRLDEGPVLTTNLMTDDLDALRCDQRVSVVWEALPDGRHLPLFHPDDEAGT
mgnify:CR=1 FL=1